MALRSSKGLATALSLRKMRSRVLRALSRLMNLVMVTRRVCPDFASMAMVVLSRKEGRSIATEGAEAREGSNESKTRAAGVPGRTYDSGS